MAAARSSSGGGRPSRLLSRESAFLLNNVFFLAITFAVLFGTLLPLFVATTSGETISVGAPWFSRVTAPIFVALLFLMGVGPALPWGAASWATVRERFTVPLLVGGRGGVASPSSLGLREPGAARHAGPGRLRRGRSCSTRSSAAPDPALATRGEAPPTATWRLATRNRRRYGGYAVHLGVLVMAVAVAVSSGLAVDTHRDPRAGRDGEHRSVHRHARAPGGRAAGERRAGDRDSRRGPIRRVPRAGRSHTALRDYPSSPTAIATPAVRTSLGEDLYVTLLASDAASGAVTLHLFVNPLVVWIWIGGAIVGLGAIFAMWPERRTQAVTVEERRPATVVPAEGG